MGKNEKKIEKYWFIRVFFPAQSKVGRVYYCIFMYTCL